MATITGYFDGHTAINDPDTNWFSGTQGYAFDGNVNTNAEPVTISSPTSGYLEGKGTNLSTDLGTISQVEVRLGMNDYGILYGPWGTITAPGGSWSWSKINNLETRIWTDTSNSAYIYAQGDSGGTLLGGGGQNGAWKVSIVEVRVTYTPNPSTLTNITQLSNIQSITF